MKGTIIPTVSACIIMIKDGTAGNSPAQRRKDAGVSEIVGDILILGITVVLFTSIFFFVNAIPTPNAQTYADFQASVSQPVTNGLTTQELLNITHLGGQTLNSGTTSVVIEVNQTVSVYPLQAGNFVGSTGSLSPWTATRWSTNQVWSVNETDISTGSVVSVTIINTASNYVVWSTVLTGKSSILLPFIQNAYASPSPVSPGKNVTIYAVVLGNAKYVNASVSFLNSVKGSLQLAYSGGFYTGVVQTSANLTSGQFYPVQIQATTSKGQMVNYTFTTLVENNGPTIITASVNPNPVTPGGYFNFTAYVVDPNSAEFSPVQGVGNVTISPYGPPVLTNITVTGADAARMVPSPYSGIFTYPGRVDLNVYGFETFVINATDAQGDWTVYYVTLVVLNTLNPGFLNSSYPSTYLGPASMTYSNFKWYPAGSPQSTATGYAVSTADVTSPGVYFQVEVANHNTSNTLYLDDLTNIYMFGGAQAGFQQYSAFIVLNGSNGATYLAPSANNAGYKSNTYTGTTQTAYPSLHWQPAAPWTNYSITSGMSSTSFVVLPAAVGGVQVTASLVFGAGDFGSGSTFGANIPSISGGPFGGNGNSKDWPSAGSITLSFMELFGYFMPYQAMPWTTFPTAGIPYGQSIPFSGLYWY